MAPETPTPSSIPMTYTETWYCPECAATGTFWAKRGKGTRTRTIPVRCANCDGQGTITRTLQLMTVKEFQQRLCT